MTVSLLNQSPILTPKFEMCEFRTAYFIQLRLYIPTAHLQYILSAYNYKDESDTAIYMHILGRGLGVREGEEKWVYRQAW